MQDRSGTKKTDAGDDLSRHPCARVSAAEPLDGSDCEQRGAHSDKGVRSDAGRFPGELAFEADDGADDPGNQDADEAFDLWVMRIALRSSEGMLSSRLRVSAGPRDGRH
jgi:hypothetical protein